MTGKAPRTPRPSAGALARGTAIGLVLLLAGCSYVPDWANPVELYDSVAGGDAPPPEQADTAIARPVPGADQNFPTLASVPERPQTPTSSAERARVAQGLVADRDNAKYTEQVANAALQQQSANLAPPPAAPPPAAPPPAAPPRAAPAASTGASDGGADRPPSLGSAPPPPPPTPPPAASVAQGNDTAAGGITAPPPPTVTAPSPTMTAPAPPPAYADGRPRMQVPEIVQRSPSTDERQSGRASSMPPTPPAIGDSVPRPPAATPPVAPPSPPPSTAAAGLPSQVRAATTPPPTPPPPTPPRVTQRPPAATTTPAATTAPAAPTQPDASVTAQRLNLPVAQDQQVLANAFASSVAAQQDSVVTDGAGTTYIGGAPSGASAAAGASALPPGAQAGLVATINFGHGSSRLGSGDLRKVREVATTAKQSGRTVRVVGHSSQRTGNMSFERHLIANFNISMDRANAVARALAEAGVPAEQIVVEAVGDQQPVYFEFMPNGEAENRRAEIFLE